MTASPAPVLQGDTCPRRQQHPSMRPRKARDRVQSARRGVPGYIQAGEFLDDHHDRRRRSVESCRCNAVFPGRVERFQEAHVCSWFRNGSRQLLVGWVQRSATHREGLGSVGCAPLHPPYGDRLLGHFEKSRPGSSGPLPTSLKLKMRSSRQVTFPARGGPSVRKRPRTSFWNAARPRIGLP